MQVLKWLRNLLAIWGGVALCWFAYTYVIDRFWVFPWHWEEQMRLTSPSGKKELLGFRGNRGAMSSYRYSYFVVRRGQHIDPNEKDGYDAIFVCSGPAPKPGWVSDTQITIPIGDLRVFYYAPRKKDLDVAVDVAVEGVTALKR